MTKVYEALLRADRERNDNARNSGVPEPPGTDALPKSLEEKLIALNHQIEAAIPTADGCRVVEFTGVMHAEHASRLVYQFARLMACRMNRRVLLMAAGQFPYIRGVFSGEGPDQWEELIKDGELNGKVSHPAQETDATTLSLVKAPSGSLPTLFATRESRSLLQDLRQRFDLIIIDAPPVPQSLNAGLMASQTDGVVLVVESEKVRWQVVQHAIQQVTGHNGRILGIIINNKRHYIPEFIYKRLL